MLLKFLAVGLKIVSELTHNNIIELVRQVWIY